MTGEPWRFRCPEGHASVQLGTEYFWCDACGTSYPKDELTDVTPDPSP